MASFAALSEEQRWQVAFYVFSLRFSEDSAKAGAALFQSKKVPDELRTVANLATSSDDQLLEKLKPYVAQESEALNLLAYLRRGALEAKVSDPLLIARELLGEAIALYNKGDKEQAYQKAVEAYLDGFELAEPTLFAKDRSFGRRLEGLFTQFRNEIKQGEAPEKIQKLHLEIEMKLDQAAQILAHDESFSGYYAFANSALIILREGLEAALILAAIIAMLKVMGALVLYAIFLKSLGFLLLTFFLTVYLFRIIEPMGWRRVLIGAILTAFGSYVVFEVWLEAQLPTGIFGF